MNFPPPLPPLQPPPLPANDHASLYPPAKPQRTHRVRLISLLKYIVLILMFIAASFPVAMLIHLYDLAAWFSLPPFVTAERRSLPMSTLLLTGLVSPWLNIVPHELGHAIAGTARGMRLRVFSVGPIRIERNADDRWRMRWGGNVRGIGGAAVILPDPKRPPSRIDQCIFTLGGPSANLWTAALCAWILVVFALPDTIHAMVFGFGAAALFIGILNLLPFQTQGWQSDGRALVEMFHRSDRAQARHRMMQLAQQYQAGIRPRDWPPQLIPGPEPDTGTCSIQAFHVNSMRLAYAADRDDMTMWHECIQWLVDHYWETPVMMHQANAGSIAGYAALVLRDPTLVAAWRPLCKGGLLNLSAHLHWLDAEQAALLGDTTTLRQQITQARAAFPTILSPVEALLLSERLDALEQQEIKREGNSPPLPL